MKLEVMEQKCRQSIVQDLHVGRQANLQQAGSACASLRQCRGAGEAHVSVCVEDVAVVDDSCDACQAVAHDANGVCTLSPGVSRAQTSALQFPGPCLQEASRTAACAIQTGPELTEGCCKKLHALGSSRAEQSCARVQTPQDAVSSCTEHALLACRAGQGRTEHGRLPLHAPPVASQIAVPAAINIISSKHRHGGQIIRFGRAAAWPVKTSDASLTGLGASCRPWQTCGQELAWGVARACRRGTRPRILPRSRGFAPPSPARQGCVRRWLSSQLSHGGLERLVSQCWPLSACSSCARQDLLGSPCHAPPALAEKQLLAKTALGIAA